MNPFQSEKGLDFFCKSQSSFKTRLGILSLYQAQFPKWLEILLLSIEYLQLLSLTILIHPTVYQLSNSTTKGPFVFEFVAYIMKLVNPSNLLSFAQNDSTTNVVLVIILGFILAKYILLGYVIYISWFNKTSDSLLKTIWRWIFKLQGRVTCCFITSFWIRTIVMTSNNSISIQGISNQAFIMTSALLTILEYTTSFLLETQLCNLMPSKSFLSSKNLDMQILTLFQKLVIQITQLFAYKDLTACLWVVIILNLTISFTREFRLFTILPLYNYKSLLYQGDLAALVLSLNLAHFFQQILTSNNDFPFMIITWIIFGVMSCRLSRVHVKHIYTQLLTSYQPKQNPNLLLHKIFATKYLIQNTKMPSDQTGKLDIKYLLGVTQTLHLPQVFNRNPQSKPTSLYMIMNSKEEETAIILEYLENLDDQFPTNSLLKLNLAYYSYKSTTTITKFRSKILNENILSPYHVSVALFLYDLEAKNISGTQKNSLNLINFIENKIEMQDIQNEILKQINLQKRVCEHIIGERPDLEAIYQNSQVIHHSKTLIQKKITSLLKRAPEYYLDPLLVFAEYNLYLNYSIEDYYNYYENYSRKLSKFTKEFEMNRISEENLYQSENAFLIISAENNSIVYSTKSLQNICGLERNNYIGTQLTRLFPRALQEYYNKILIKGLIEKGANQNFKIFLSHQEGWLLEADIFARVHPFTSQNLFVDLIIRPHRSSADFILLDEAGNIQGVTRNISQFFESNKPPKAPLHIKQISEELYHLNAAFKIINKNTSSSELGHDKALRIYNLYTEDQKLVELHNKCFQCKISKLDSDPPLNQIQLTSALHQIDNLTENSIHFENDHLLEPFNTYCGDTEENLVTPRPLLLRNPDKFNLVRKISLVSKPASVDNSKVSPNSGGVEKTFQWAISARSHQRSFKFLCLVFYGVILGTLICQIVLKSVLDTTMSHLMIKTDLLNFAQRRTLQVCVIHNVARGCALIMDGLLTSSDLNTADRPLRNNLVSMVLPEQVLTQSNEGIVNNIASESSAIQHLLFEQDVQIKGSIADPEDSKTELVSNFQHSDILRNAIRILNSLPFVASDAGANAFDFLTLNSANHFLVKNNQIIEVFQASVSDQKENLQQMINLSVIALPILLTGIVCLLAIIILKQYNKEKHLLLAFLKLNPNSIQRISETLELFEKRILQQEKHQNSLVQKQIDQLSNAVESSSYHKGHDSRVVLPKNMQKRYFFYIFKVLFYIALLITIVIVNYVSISTSIEGIYRQQSQIQFANDIGSIASVTYIAFSETFATNNTNYIMGQPPFDVLTSGIKNLSKIQGTLYSKFQLKNGDYDPAVKSILFDEIDCNRFVASPYDNCISLKTLGLPSNLVSTVTLLKNRLDLKLAQFLAVNRSSSAAMLSTATANLSLILAPYRVTSSGAQLISEIISEKLTHSIADIYDLGTTILTIFSMALVVVSVLIWFQILTKVKRVNDNFKKVLAVLPPNIILSSFLLKSFLNKTSNIPQKL